MRRLSFTITEGDPYVRCPVRARHIPVDFCVDCPWFEDVDVGQVSRSWLPCEPPGYWPLRLEVGFATGRRASSGADSPHAGGAHEETQT